MTCELNIKKETDKARSIEEEIQLLSVAAEQQPSSLVPAPVASASAAVPLAQVTETVTTPVVASPNRRLVALYADLQTQQAKLDKLVTTKSKYEAVLASKK